MKKVLVMVALVMVSVIVYAFNDSGESNQGKKEVTGNGEVVVMDKDMFLKDVFDYEKSKGKAFLYGGLSGVVEPVAGVFGALLAILIAPIMPFTLSFAAGAMIYVVVEELVPEMHMGEHRDRKSTRLNSSHAT